MSRNITGNLILPDGSSTGAGTLTFIADISVNGVLEGTHVEEPVDSSGYYFKQLIDGRYLVYFDRPNHNRIYLGKIGVTTGANIALDEILVETNPVVDTDIRDYINNLVAGLLGGKQDVGVYTPPPDGYEDDFTPSAPSNLALSHYRVNTAGSTTYRLKADWDASTNTSATPINYRVTCYDINNTSEVLSIVTQNLVALFPVEKDKTYRVTVVAVSAIGTNNVGGSAFAEETVSSDAIVAITRSTINGISGIGFIGLSWQNPFVGAFTKVYVGSTPEFTCDDENLIFYGQAPAFFWQIPYDDPQPDTEYWFRFITFNNLGDQSAQVGSLTAFKGLRITDSTIGKVLHEAQLQAQHIANGAIIQDKIAARAMVASKFAVTNLTNLIENPNFTDYDLGTSVVWPGWDYSESPTQPVNVSTADDDLFIELTGFSIVDNDYKFECTSGERYYAAAKISWSGNASTFRRGVQIIFLDEDGLDITVDPLKAYTDADVYDSADELVEEFYTAPPGAVTGFIQLVTENGLSVNVKFDSITCRAGAAVLIEPGGITADRVDVFSLGVYEAIIYGLLKTGENVASGSGDQSGMIVSSNGLHLYDSSGVEVVTLNSSDGSATFKGNISGSSISASTFIAGVTGGIYSDGKINYGSAVPGFFLGYDSGNYKMDIGDATNYLKWTGTALEVKGAISGSSISGSEIYGSEIILDNIGKLHSDGKDTYSDSTPGVFLGYDSGAYKLNIGDSNDYVKWDGTDILVSNRNELAYGTKTGTYTVFTYVYTLGSGTSTYFTKRVYIDTGYDSTVNINNIRGKSLAARVKVTAGGLVYGGSAPPTGVDLFDARALVAGIMTIVPHQTTGSTGPEGGSIFIAVDVSVSGVNIWDTNDDLTINFTALEWSLKESM